MIEIGSEFQYMDNRKGFGVRIPNEIKDYTYTFSGRTAIETVLKNESNIRKIMLPSYCCDSMIEPIRSQGIEVCFYPVRYNNGLQIDLKIERNVDAILWCDYFGFKLEMPDFTEFIKNGGIIIEDITHSFFSENQYNKQSQYLVGSLRKWEPILCGGFCAAVNKELLYKPTELPTQEFLYKKKRAMLLKKDYLEGNTDIEKNEFLNYFSESNAWLAKHYSELAMDEESIAFLNCADSEKHILQRKENAKTLYDGLKNCKIIKFLFQEEDMKCPLFVPILVNDRNRDNLRRKLIENDIYCPIHWPKPNEKCESNLYDLELSLICDQRYTKKDMQRIIEIIKKYEGELEDAK